MLRRCCCISLLANYATFSIDAWYSGTDVPAYARAMSCPVLTSAVLLYHSQVAGARLRPCSAYLGMGLRACYSMPMSGQGTESTNLEDHATNLRNSNAKKNGVLAQPVLTSWVLAIGSRDWLWESRSGQSGSKDVSRRGSVTGIEPFPYRPMRVLRKDRYRPTVCCYQAREETPQRNSKVTCEINATFHSSGTKLYEQRGRSCLISRATLTSRTPHAQHQTMCGGARLSPRHPRWCQSRKQLRSFLR